MALWAQAYIWMVSPHSQWTFFSTLARLLGNAQRVIIQRLPQILEYDSLCNWRVSDPRRKISYRLSQASALCSKSTHQVFLASWLVVYQSSHFSFQIPSKIFWPWLLLATRPLLWGEEHSWLSASPWDHEFLAARYDLGVSFCALPATKQAVPFHFTSFLLIYFSRLS